MAWDYNPVSEVQPVSHVPPTTSIASTAPEKRARPRVNRLFADFGVRMAAIAMDTFIVLYLAQLVLNGVLVEIGMQAVDHRPITLVVMFVYFVAFWISPMRATPGQFLLGMRVVSLQCNRLTPRDAALRGAALAALFAGITMSIATYSYLTVIALPACLLILLAAVTPNRQAGHDLLSGSLVVNRIALNSPEHNALLHQHLADRDPQTLSRRRPSIFSMFVNLAVMAAPIFLLITTAGVMKAKDLSYRTHYAMQEVHDLQMAVEDFHAKHRRLPQPGDALAVATTARYPAGGYYQLEQDAAIRIQFEIKPELKHGSILITPAVSGRRIDWHCRAQGDIKLRDLPRECRQT